MHQIAGAPATWACCDQTRGYRQPKSLRQKEKQCLHLPSRGASETWTDARLKPCTVMLSGLAQPALYVRLTSLAVPAAAALPAAGPRVELGLLLLHIVLRPAVGCTETSCSSMQTGLQLELGQSWQRQSAPAAASRYHCQPVPEQT